MSGPEPAPITELLRLAKTGDLHAEELLFKSLLAELRRMAVARMRRERCDHTLQPTALVNEAYVRLSAQRDKDYQNRAHFLAVAAQVMHCVLVDYARARKAGKRLGGVRRVELDVNLPSTATGWSDEILALDASLKRLAAFDARGARIVELKIFAGMTDAEVAEVIGKAPRTIKRDFRAAKAWLTGDLRRRSPAGDGVPAEKKGQEIDA